MRKFLFSIVLLSACAGQLAAQSGGGSGKTVILVHGVHPIMEDFLPLERLFSSRGYAVITHRYNSNQRLDSSARQLAANLCELKPRSGEILIVAHSMGGLVARRAVSEGDYACEAAPLDITLLTIASPFGGFGSANNAAAVPFNVFGIKPYMRDVGSRSEFITEPGRLPPNVRHYLVFTDESGAVIERSGKKYSDSKVPLASQYNGAVQNDPQVKGSVQLEAGHVGVINAGGQVSAELEKIISRLAR